jgi:allantoicase
LKIRLGYAGSVSRLVLDTSFYRYNASESVSVAGSATDDDTAEWATLLRRTMVQPDTIHDLSAESAPPVRFVRVDAFPDGGISRVRVIGHLDAVARAAAGRQWWNALPEQQAAHVLATAGVPTDAAAALVADRPVPLGRGAPEPLRLLLDGPD